MIASDPFGWTGSSIGLYPVEAVTAAGGFGVVYRARHPVFNEPVAIKCLKLRPDLPHDERVKFVKWFINEGRILYRLSRDADSIVQPLDLNVATSPRGFFTPYLVMEWLRGETLAHELRERAVRGYAPWALDEALTMLAPIFEALEVAHARKIVHRDIKPANIFLREGFRARTAKLLDFGVAKVMSHSAASTRRVFTLRYVAPEQLDRRVGPTAPWTDVYALALVLVEMLAGVPAYRGTAPQEIMAEAMNRMSRPTPRAHGVDLGHALELVFFRALAVDPAARYPDAGAFYEALSRLTRDDVISAPARPPIVRTIDEPTLDV